MQSNLELHPIEAPDPVFEKASKELVMIPNIITRKKQVGFAWDTGKGWFWTHKKGSPDGAITGDKNDFYKYGYAYCEGVITHEPAHAILSKDLIEEFTKEEWNQPGFAVGVNWFEDNRIEYAADNLINDGRNKIKGHLDIDVQPGHGLDFALDSKGAGEMGVVQDKLGYIPRHMRFGAVARNYFYEKEITGTLKTQADLDAFVARVRAVDQITADAFVNLRPHIERYCHTVPGKFPAKEQIKQKAREAAAIYRNYIWPEYKKLIEESFNDHALKKFIEALAAGKKFQGKNPQDQVIVISIDDLPKEIQDEIKEQIKEQQKKSGGKQEEQAQGTPQPSGEGGEQGKQKESMPSQGGGMPQAGGEGGQPDEQKTGESQKTGKEGKGKGNSPYDKLSDKAKDEVKKAWDQIDKNQKDKISSDAAEEMGETEDDLNKELQAHSDESGVNRPTEVAKNASKNDASQQQSQDQQEGQNQPSASKQPSESQSEGDSSSSQQTHVDMPTEQDFNELQKYREKNLKPETPETAYDGRLQESRIQKAVDFLNSNVTLDPNAKPRYFYAEEGELDIQKDIDADMEGSLDSNPFIVEGEKQKMELRFLTLADVSGSMNSLRQELLDFLVIQTEYLTHQGVDNAACAFTDESGGGFSKGVLRVLKKFEDTEGFGAVVPKKVKQQIGKVLDTNFGGGGTPTSTAMRAGYEYVLLPRHMESSQVAKSRSFIFLLTDGRPTDTMPRMSSVESARETQKKLYELAKQENMELSILCLGIGPGTQFVKDISVALPPDLQSEMAKKLSSIRGEKVNPNDVTTSFQNIDEMVLVWPIILEYIMKYPEEFENFVEKR